MYSAKVSIIINASLANVWKTLTDPELVRQYLFGTNVFTDWKKGSQIRWTGIWEDKKYEDKGQIIEVVFEKLIIYTYWSSMSGLEDKKENYATVSYILDGQNGKVKLTITQDNIKTKESKEHSESSWTMVGNSLKKVAENL